ncbi:hypothetical protein ACJJTC_007626 [Scirpophaga incertulas]
MARCECEVVLCRAEWAGGAAERLAVRTVRLEGASLWAARAAGGDAHDAHDAHDGPLLHAPAPLVFVIEANLTRRCPAVPDVSTRCTLATLECALSAAHYRLVRAVLAHNLAAGPALQTAPPAPPAPTAPPCGQVMKHT